MIADFLHGRTRAILGGTVEDRPCGCRIIRGGSVVIVRECRTHRTPARAETASAWWDIHGMHTDDRGATR